MSASGERQRAPGTVGCPRPRVQVTWADERAAHGVTQTGNHWQSALATKEILQRKRRLCVKPPSASARPSASDAKADAGLCASPVPSSLSSKNSSLRKRPTDPRTEARHSLTLTWSSSLARLAAAAAMATLTAAALVAVTLVAAAAPGQQRELSLQCWRQLAAAAGGGGWRRHCWRQPCGGGAAVAARRRRCSALPQQARPDSTGSLPARPAHSNAPAAPADCWMATVANVGEVVRRRDQLIRRRRSLDHGRRRRLTRVHGRIQQACSPPAL